MIKQECTVEIWNNSSNPEDLEIIASSFEEFFINEINGLGKLR